MGFCLSMACPDAVPTNPNSFQPMAMIPTKFWCDPPILNLTSGGPRYLVGTFYSVQVHAVPLLTLGRYVPVDLMYIWSTYGVHVCTSIIDVVNVHGVS